MCLTNFHFGAIAPVLLCSFSLSAQVFTAITDPTNPINTVPHAASYNGCALVDVDGDGDLDVSMLGYLFRNEGAEKFTQINSFGDGNAVGLGSVSWADYENDGDLDCLLGTGFRTEIFVNDGGGNFTRKNVTAATLPTWSAQWGELNNDGLMEVMITVANGFSGLNTPNFLFIGQPDGSFQSQSEEFTRSRAPYTVTYFSDFDVDGDLDVFIASGPGGSPGPDFLYRNRFKETGSYKLERINDLPFATQQQDGQCYNFIDSDNDGDLDLCITNWTGASNRFYENLNGTFAGRSNALTFNAACLSNCWGDFDNDGDLDVILTAGQANRGGYYKNNGNNSFAQMGNPFNAFGGSSLSVNGISAGDFDNDGDLDFFAIGNGNFSKLFRNDLTGDNHWVNFTLEGSPTNRAAIGTRIFLKATINGAPVWLQREISCQNTFMGHNSLRAHFGLGDATIIDSLDIRWLSGNREIYTNVEIERFYKIKEGEGISTAVKDFEKTDDKMQIYPNPADSNFVRLSLPAKKSAEGTGLFSLYSMEGKLIFSEKIRLAGETTADIELPGLQKGIYLASLQIKAERFAEKLVIR